MKPAMKRRDVLAWGAASLMMTSCTSKEPPPPERMASQRLKPLPQALGGQFAGVHKGALIVAGGSYFPTPKWEGGEKRWVNSVYVMRKPIPITAREGGWETFALPAPRAYGGTVSNADGVLLIGGSDEKAHYREVLRVRWDGSTISVSEAAPLPVSLANCAAVEVTGVAYVVGGQETPEATSASKALYSLDLGRTNAEWKEEAALPGAGRILPAVAALDGKLYVASGADLYSDEDGKAARRYLQDAWCFTPGQGWEQLPDLPRATCAAPAAGYPNTFLVFGGSDGTLDARADELKDDHPGFSREILLYRPSEGAWRTAGFHAVEGLVTTTAARWDDDYFVIPGGEDRPAHRSATVSRYLYVPEGAGVE
ncbi:MAG: hypothetical protein U5J83_15500 [Bryobacterales bacterium]|nr:hypothetical protein [Bryobacterales bacterium]